MWALLILPYLFICCLPLYFVFIEMYWWQKLAVNLFFFKSKVNVAGLRELTRACIGVNDCSYFSFKSEVTNHNILCPPQTELCVTGPVERELKHSCLITLPIEFSFWTTSLPVFQHWKPSCNHQSSWEILCPSRSGFHSPCCSDKDGSGGQQCPAPGAGVTVGDEEAQSWGQTHRCSFKLHLSQEGKSLFWWIKSLKLIPTQNDFPALAVKEGGVLRESLGYRRQWQRRVADLSHLRQSSAMMENCPKHLQSQVRAWLRTRNTNRAHRAQIFFQIKRHPLSPLSSLSIMTRKKQSNAILFIKQESVANSSSSSQYNPRTTAFPLNLPWGVKLSEDKSICTVQLPTQLGECQLRKCKVYALYYWSQEYRFNIHSCDAFCQGSCARSCTFTFWCFQWYFLLRSCSATKHSKLILLDSQEKIPPHLKLQARKHSENPHSMYFLSAVKSDRHQGLNILHCQENI